MKRIFLCASWIGLSVGLYAGLLLVESYWNLFNWVPKLDLASFALLGTLAGLLTGIWLLARAARDRVTRSAALLVGLGLAAVGLHALGSEPLSEGLLGRTLASPTWYRAGRLLLLTLPLLFWTWSSWICPCPCAGQNYNGAMKHAGKARQAGLKLMVLSLTIVICVVAVWSYLAGRMVTPVALVLGVTWLLFLVFCLNFFRDPEATVPAESRAFVSPGHGTVDVIDEVTEKVFMGEKCRRISIFLSVFNVHIQNSPVSGRIRLLRHTSGKFVNAMRSDCGECNENVLIGIESTEAAGERVAVKLIAGLIARRIVPWIAEGETIAKSERISLIQFGSRVDLYLPSSVSVQVKLGQKVVGGETIMATRN
jgi:phosphatidylserine decarboxylase